MLVSFLISNVTSKALSVKGSGKKIGVMVTILPLAYFIEKIGGERVNVSVVIPPGASPHTYEPTPRQLRRLSEAELYVKVGSGIQFEEEWLNRLVSLNRSMRICNSSKGIKLIQNREHNHHEKGGHPPDKDPHVWVSPLNAVVMAKNIKDSLIEIDPENSKFYARNAEKLVLELNALDKEIRERLSGLKSRSFMVFHPSWGYFSSVYDLEQIPIEIEGKEPSAKALTQLIDRARRRNIKVIFTSPQFSTKSAEVIAREIKGRVVFIDPLAKDYIENLRKIADIFVEVSK